MKLEAAPRAGPTRRRLTSRLDLRHGVAAAIVCALIGAGLFTGIALGARLQERGKGHYVAPITNSHFAQRVLFPLMSTLRATLTERQNVPLNLARGLASDPPRLVLDIKHTDYQKLAAKREEALGIGVLFSEKSDYVPATITLDGRAAKGKLRLKGDAKDHYETDKWSLRIKLSGDQTLMGMKIFSIQHPETRGFIGEWVLLEALRREGGIAPRYRFIDVTINGDHKGVYAMEEHFEKRMVENSSRREGPILKFEEDLSWRSMLLFGGEREYGTFVSSAIGGWAAEQGHGSAFERAVSLLGAFRRGELQTNDVFDVEKLAIFLALRDLGGTQGTVWQNVRFYFDPVTSKLEPIGFDNEVQPDYRTSELFSAGGGRSIKGDPTGDTPESLIQRMFDDAIFFEHYVRALERVSQPEYLEQLFEGMREEFEGELTVLHRDYPFTRRWTGEFLHDNQAFIRAALSPPRAIEAHHESDVGSEMYLRIGNIQSLPIEILGLSIDGRPPIPPSEAHVLRSKGHRTPVDFQRVAFALASEPGTPAPPPGDLEVHYRLVGRDETRHVAVLPWAHRLDEVVDESWLTTASNLDAEPFLRRAEDGSVVLLPGSWTLDHTLVVRDVKRLVAGPGVRLDLRNGARLISYAPLQLQGSDEDPVRIESSDGSGQGVLVIQAPDRSVVRHTIFRNLGELQELGWTVPGAVTFYESPVDLDHVQFRESRSEDSLNIMRTSFTMTHTAFVDAGGDAFDGDFVTGRVADTGFLRTANDAIDVSGSEIEIERVRMNTVGDKALSAGERSRVTARELDVDGARLGVASKDLSQVELASVSIARTAIGFAAFQKKSEFGSASIQIDGATLADVEQDYLIEQGSSVILEGDTIPGDERNVGDRLYATPPELVSDNELSSEDELVSEQ